jgi:hypothetical protein
VVPVTIAPETRTAPLSPAAVEALARLEDALESPVDRLKRQIADLEISLRVHRQLRDSDYVQMRNPMASVQERAEAEQWFRTAVANIAFVRGELARRRAELAAVAQYETAAVHAVQLAALAEVGKLSDLDADSLAHAEDLMAAARKTLADAGRLDLIEVAA